MEVKASAKYLKISPRKLRLLCSGLRGLTAQKALEKLGLYPQRGSELLVKVIKQAVANAVTNFKLQKENLRVKKIEVGEGPSSKRMDKSHGARFDRGIIKRRSAHLFLTLESEETKNKTESKKETSSIIKKSAKERTSGTKS